MKFKMERIIYTAEKMELIKSKINELITVVTELETEFPGRHFTLDGHLMGSIGEVMAAYYYGIELYKSSTERHDGVIGGKEVQIKITQQDDVLISAEPEFLVVLYLTKNGDIYEVYNGRGMKPWNMASKYDSHNNRHMRVNKLLELDAEVPQEDRIVAVHAIRKMKKEYKNRKYRL